MGNVLALACVILLQGTPLSLLPSDDVWVYPHAADPMKDEYIRVWGADGKSVCDKSSVIDSFSYSYLQFPLPADAAKKKLAKAKLVLFSVADPAWIGAMSKAAPIEVRSLTSGFAEKTWNWDEGVKKYLPGATKEDVFAVWSGSENTTAGKPLKVEIDLLAGPAKFPDYWAQALSSGKPLALALTSKIDPAETERAGIYKLYSKEAGEELRPRLIVELTDGN